VSGDQTELPGPRDSLGAVGRPKLAQDVSHVLLDRVERHHQFVGAQATRPAQRAVLTLITTGDLERHIRRMRHEYTRRRALVTAAFADGKAQPVVPGVGKPRCLFLIKVLRPAFPYLLLCQAVGIFAFGVSWFVKGQTLIGALKDPPAPVTEPVVQL
jgi:hypothetical protein